MAITPKVSTNYTLRVATYNIKAGAKVGRKVEAIAENIRALDLDIVGLQEVDICTKRSGSIDQLQAIAEYAGFPYFRFAFSMDYDDGEYGTAILSKHPILEYKTVKLETNKFEARSVGCALIEVAGEQIHFFNTHLSFEDDFTRYIQIARIAALVADLSKENNNYIITGDFNTEFMMEFRILPKSILVNYGELKTFPKTNEAIDNIIVSPHWQVEEYYMVETKHSDHNLLYAVLGKKKYIREVARKRKSHMQMLLGRKI